MEAREIRNMTSADIQRRIDDSYHELFNLRFQAATGQLKNTNRLTEVKKDIARLKTALRERELQGEGLPQ